MDFYGFNQAFLIIPIYRKCVAYSLGIHSVE